MKKKILFYTTFLTQGGGIEVVTVRYMKKFLQEGYEVDLYVDYNMGEENIREKEIDKSIKIKYLKSEKLSKLIYKLRTLGKTKKIYNIPLYFLIIISDYLVWRREVKIVQRRNYDITMTFFQYLPSYITKVKGPKHQIYLHGSVTRFFDGIRKYFKKSFFRKLEKFDEVCTVSKEMGEELVKLAPNLKEKQKTVYNPIDIEEIEKKSKDDSELTEWEKILIKEKYICSVGRLDEIDKDFTTLIRAFGELKKEERVEEKLVIVGDGPDRKKLEGLVNEFEIRDVIFLGKKSNPYIWIRNSKLFVLSSKSEGFPTVLIEAKLLGCNILTSDYSGVMEIIEDKESLFRVGNIEMLKEKIVIRRN